jgi:hypothetical protein
VAGVVEGCALGGVAGAGTGPAGVSGLLDSSMAGGVCCTVAGVAGACPASAVAIEVVALLDGGVAGALVWLGPSDLVL